MTLFFLSFKEATWKGVTTISFCVPCLGQHATIHLSGPEGHRLSRYTQAVGQPQSDSRQTIGCSRHNWCYTWRYCSFVPKLFGSKQHTLKALLKTARSYRQFTTQTQQVCYTIRSTLFLKLKTRAHFSLAVTKLSNPMRSKCAFLWPRSSCQRPTDCSLYNNTARVWRWTDTLAQER